MVTSDFTFDLSGGRLCLDFANTVSNRGSEAPVDHLHSYADLLAFVEQTGSVSRPVARDLARRAEAHPANARDALDRAVAVREALYRMFAALAGGHRPKPADVASINDQLATALSRSRLAPSDDHFVLKVEAASDDLASPLAPIVKSAVDLLTSAEIERIRTCAADTCEWLFLDTTKNHTRRWCDMKVCGNRAKVRRFRSRA